MAKQLLCNAKLGTHPAVTPIPNSSLDWWAQRHKAVLERNKQGNIDLIMVGDSITHRWEPYENNPNGLKIWNQYYTKRKAVNMGFGGDRTQHTLWRMQNGEIDGINTKLAVLLSGTNNCNSDDTTPEHIADGIKAIVCEIRKRLPNTKILVIGLFPRGTNKQFEDKCLQTEYNVQWEKNDNANKLIAELADGKMMYYLNINNAFLNDKKVLTSDIAWDLIHLSEKGYKIWAEAMESTIVKLMGENKI